jgi:hypothetical protein
MLDKEYFEIHLKENKFRRIAWEVLSEYLDSFITIRNSLLEIGPGYCDFINNAKFETKVAIDLSPELVNRVSSSVIPVIGNIVDSIPTLSNFDIILCSNFFEHLNDEEFLLTLATCYEKLTYGGKLIVLQPNFKYSYKTYFDDYTHKKIFTNISMRSHLIKAGFRIYVEIPRFLPYSLSHAPKSIPGFLFKYGLKLYLKLPFKPMSGQMLFVAQKVP